MCIAQCFVALQWEKDKECSAVCPNPWAANITTPNQEKELGSVPRPPPATLCRDAQQGASPGEPPPLPMDPQAGQTLPPCLLQLVEGVCGVVPGRAEAEDLVVLLQSCLPAFCTAVRHLEQGDSAGIRCGSRRMS